VSIVLPPGIRVRLLRSPSSIQAPLLNPFRPAGTRSSPRIRVHSSGVASSPLFPSHYDIAETLFSPRFRILMPSSKMGLRFTPQHHGEILNESVSSLKTRNLELPKHHRVIQLQSKHLTFRSPPIR
jgi:hypothetical protein